ncbi:MAG TPA: fibronectin type III domain-containing protein, partial [Gemmataceae bacterium]|nr:fibronectin type III domain-containing protein [Gemmataceae bacterium]
FSGVVSTPAYFNGQLYVVGAYSDFLKSFTINSDGTLSATSETSETFGFEPGSPVISADGTSDGILWITNLATNELQAYDPSNLSDLLWSSGQGANALGSAIKFAPPVVANGEVFVGTANGLVVYGLNTPNAVPQTPTLSATVLSGTSVNLSWQDSSQLPNIASSYTIEESTDGVNFTPVTTAAPEATSLMIGGLTPGTNYWFQISGVNSIGASPYSNVVAVTTSAASGIGGNATNLSSQLTYNGSATANGSSAQLTDGGTNEAGSVFTSNPVDIDAFETQFTFQLSAGGDTADGFTFTIQNAGPTALGPSGGGLGYGPDTTGGYGGIPQSVAIKFDLYSNAGEGDDSTGLYTDGASPTVPAIDLSNTGINLHSGDVFQVNMTYDGTTLTVVITDTNTGASATQSYTIDIPGTVGGDTAYVGFTGGTGGNTATQDILSWSFSPPSSQAPATPTGLSATPTSGSSVLLSWTNGSTNQTGYYLDRATNPGFTQNLITEALPGGASSFTDTAIGLAPGGTYYYRLRAVNSAGSSVNTATVAVTIPMPPPPPSNAVITAVTSNAIALSWTDNAGALATGYQIWRSTSGGPFILVATLPAGSTSWRDTSVSPGTSYEYSVVAYNVSGSNGAAETGATTSPAPPANPVAAVANEVTSLLPSLLHLELDAVLLSTYLRLASSGNGMGESAAALKTEILGLWSAIGSNPLMKTPLGLYALEQGFAAGQPSGSK